MFQNLALYLRIFVLVCAAVMSLIMCSDAARASLISAQVDNRVKRQVIRRLNTPNKQHHPLYTGLISSETGFQSGPLSQSVTVGNYREASPIINHQSRPQWFSGGSFGFNQNSQDNGHSHAGKTTLQSGMRPANSIFTSNSLHGGVLQSGENDHSTTRNIYNSYPAIIRRTSSKEVPQSSSASQIWALKGAQKTYNRGYNSVERNDFSNVATVKNVWQPSDLSLSSPQTGRYSSTSLPTQGGHYSSVQSRKYLSLASQTSPQAPSIRKSSHAPVIKSNPGRETPTSSITDFSQGWQSARSTVTPRQKKVQSYLFKDSQASSDAFKAYSTSQHEQRPSVGRIYGRFSSNSKTRQPPYPTKEEQHLSDKSNPKYLYANIAHYGARKDTEPQHTTAHKHALMSGLPDQGTANTIGNFVPIQSQSDFQGTFGPVSGKYVASSWADTSASASMHLQKPGRTSKSIYGYRGFTIPAWRPSTDTSVTSSSGSNESTNYQRYSRDKRKYKIAKVFPSLSRKYSFRQRGASTTATTPAKLERQPADYFSSSFGTKSIQTMSTPRPWMSRLKTTQPLRPESDAGFDSKLDPSRFRIHRRIHGLKGFGTQPLEGAKALVTEPENSTTRQQSLDGLQFREAQIWQPKSSKIEGFGYNKSAETEQSRSQANNTKLADRFKPDRYKKENKLYNFFRFKPVKNRIGNAANETNLDYKDKSTQIISSAFIRSTGPLKAHPPPKSEPEIKPKPVAMRASFLSSSTSSTVRGVRVKGKQVNTRKLNESTSLTNTAGNAAIVRLPKPLAVVKGVSYSDILSSASFSGVRATTQTPTTPADKRSRGNSTATTRAELLNRTLISENGVFSRVNSSHGSERHTEDEVKDVRVKEDKKEDDRREGADKDLKTSVLSMDTEGSGSGDFGFDMFDALSSKSNVLSEDLLELDYLRISAGNVSFKSMNVSRNDK